MRRVFLIALLLVSTAYGARSFNGTSQYLSRTSSVIGNSPSAFTLSLWVNGAAQSDATFIGFGNSSTGTPNINLGSGSSGLGQSTSSVKLYMRNDANTTIYGNTSGMSVGTVLDSTWHQIVCRWNGSQVSIVIDGTVALTSGTLTLGTVSFDRTAFGCRVATSAAQFFNGQIAEVGIWNVALTDVEAAMLSKGFAPSLIRPQSLIDYWPIIGRTTDEAGLKGLIMTNTGSTQATHPRVYR